MSDFESNLKAALNERGSAKWTAAERKVAKVVFAKQSKKRTRKLERWERNAADKFAGIADWDFAEFFARLKEIIQFLAKIIDLFSDDGDD